MSKTKKDMIKPCVIKGLTILMLGILVQGCAGTRQFAPSSDYSDKSKAHITVKRTGFFGTGVKVQLHDGDQHIGDIGHNGVLKWDRPAGKMNLSGYVSFGGYYYKPFELDVLAGESYSINLSMLTQKFSLKSGTPAKTHDSNAEKNIEIITQGSVMIKAIDHSLPGRKYHGTFYVTPGEHFLDLSYDSSSNYTRGQNLFKFEAKPGHTYYVGGSKVGRDMFSFYISDGVSGKNVGVKVKDKFRDY